MAKPETTPPDRIQNANQTNQLTRPEKSGNNNTNNNNDNNNSSFSFFTPPTKIVTNEDGSSDVAMEEIYNNTNTKLHLPDYSNNVNNGKKLSVL